MTPTVKLNFQNDNNFLKENYTCWAEICSDVDTQDHLIYKCKEYEHLRLNKDLSNDHDLVMFFKEVIEERLSSAEN